MTFSGEVIKGLYMDIRITIFNMIIEAGAKTGIIEPDEITLEYLKGRAKRPYQIYKSDIDAHYEKIIEIDVSKIEPQVAFPHLPENAKPISKAKGVKICLLYTSDA